MAEPSQQNVQIGPMIVNVNPTNPAEKYKGKYRALGITQVVLAVLSILFGIIVVSISNSNRDTFAVIGTGIWSGLIFLVPGILGIVSGKKPSTCPIIGAMVMTIISAVFATNMLGLEIGAAIAASSSYYYDLTPHAAIHSLMAIVAFSVLVTTIIHSAYCCAGASCCGGNTMNRQVIYTGQPGVYPNQVLLQNPNNPAMPMQIVYHGNVGVLPSTSIPQQQQQLYQQQPFQQQQFQQQQFQQQQLPQQTMPPQAPPYTEPSTPPPFYQQQQTTADGQQKLPL